jgi:MYXO-CTERM domain-containing protein
VRRFAIAALLVAVSGRARADGAFPDSMRILLPPDRPEQILVGTNFGLLVSSDAGAHFRLVCEEAIARGGENVTHYQMGPAGSLYALSSVEITRSDDRCSWTPAAGAWREPFLTDVFPDPATPGHLFALALVPAPGGTVSALFESRDGARFGDPIYTAPMAVFLTGVENAARAPGRLYLTGFDFGLRRSVLIRSTDGLRTFEPVNLAGALGDGEARLAGVDPEDERIIYYRVVDVDGDKLAISRDGGDTARVALAVEGEMTAFLRRADGTLLVGTRAQGAFQSSDGGATFAPWPEAPHLRALGERDGVLYAVADNALDPFALGASRDGGKTWTPLLRFQGICGILSCSPFVRDTCAPAWTRLVELLGITARCDAERDAAVRDAGADASVGKGGGGCGCRLGAAPPASPLLLVLLLIVLIILARTSLRRL